MKDMYGEEDNHHPRNHILSCSDSNARMCKQRESPDKRNEKKKPERCFLPLPHTPLQYTQI